MKKVNLGCVPSTPDHRDYKLTFKVISKLPTKIDLRPGLAPILDQGQLGCCTGFGISRAFRRMLKFEKLSLFQPSQLFIYYGERQMENTIDSDAGANIRDGMKVLTNGVCDIKKWPYDIAKFTYLPPAAAYQDAKAKNHQAIQYQSLNSIFDVKSALANGMSVVIGFSVYTNFFDIKADGLMPEPSGSMEGGHCVTIDGYDDKMQRFICSNSWSPKWGDKGFFYMPYSYLDPQHVFDKWIIQKI